MNWQRLEELLRTIVPESYVVEGDFYGWVGNVRPSDVKKVAVVVDILDDLDDFDFSYFDLVISHHRPYFDPVFPVFVIHTPLDRIDWGCNYALGTVLGLENLTFFDDNRFGMYGITRTTSQGFLEQVLKVLNLKNARYFLPEKIEKVAVFSGCGFNFPDFVQKLFDFNIDVAVSGDLVHHVACRLKCAGIGFVDASHYRTEIPGMLEFTRRLAKFVDAEFIDVGPPYIDICLG
ncbi:Nif3-like dinuclear metal center hexameric protein [Desulfurobacterium sp.]